MSVEMQDGIRVIKLHDSELDGAAQRANDMLTMAYLWQLLSGGHTLRDQSVFSRNIL